MKALTVKELMVNGNVKSLVGSSPFLRNNAVFFSGSLIVSVLNYLFYPVLSRMLEPAQFGEVQALLSLYAQGAIFLTILTYVTIHVTVNTDDIAKRNSILLTLERYAMLAGLAVLTIGLLLVNQLKEFLNFHEVLPFVLLIVTLALTIPLSLRMAYLRGRKQFARAIITDGSGSFGKLLLAPLFVAIGMGTFGAVFGLALSQIISLVFAVWWAHRAGFRGFGLRSAHAKLGLIRPQLSYALMVFLATSVVTALFSLDIIAIKHYFLPEQAGLFAGISTIARIIFFVTAPITGVLLTMVNLNQTVAKNRLQYLGSMGLIGLIGGLTLAFIAFFPDPIIKLLVGSDYLVFADLLPRLSLAMLLLALANATLLYNVALKRYFITGLGAAVLIATIILLQRNHSQVADVVNGVLFGSVGLVTLTVGYTLFQSRFAKQEVL